MPLHTYSSWRNNNNNNNNSGEGRGAGVRRRRNKVHSSLIFVFFVLHIAIFSFTGK